MPAPNPSFAPPPLAGEARERLLARVAFEATWERDLHSDGLCWDRNLESIFGYPHDEVGRPCVWGRARFRRATDQTPARACVPNRELRVGWDAGAAFSSNPSVVGKTVAELFAQSPDRERVLEGRRRALAGGR